MASEFDSKKINALVEAIMVWSIHLIGSTLFLLQRPLQRKHARAEELWPHPAIHRSFERSQAIDLSLRLAVAPRLSDRISHGVDVSLQCASETWHRVQASLLSVFQPDAELVNVFAFQHAPKTHGEATHCSELWQSFFSASTFAA